MNFGNAALAERYELDDLQVFDGPPMRAARTVVRTALDLLHVTAAAFIVFDDSASEAVVREVVGQLNLKPSYPLTGPVGTHVSRVHGPVKINDMSAEGAAPQGFAAFGAGAMLGVPVFAPDGQVIGLLAVFESSARIWTASEIARLEDIANLISQEIMLRASFATLGILARERLRTLS